MPYLIRENVAIGFSKGGSSLPVPIVVGVIAVIVIVAIVMFIRRGKNR